MRGYLGDYNPVLAAVLYSLQHVREDVAKWTDGVADEELWHAEGDAAPAGFHLRHIAGSTDRLISYARGEALTQAQMETLRAEQGRDVSLPELLVMLEQSLQKAEATVRATDPADFAVRREIGRKRIPTTLIGLLFHTAEHAQRHLGAMITGLKAARVIKVKR